MTGVSNVRAVDKTPILRNDASIAASVLSASANAAETVTETESGTGSTVSASGTLNEIATDANVSVTEIRNGIATETANGVTGIDGTKRIATEKAGRTVTLVVELFSPLRTAVSPLDRVIVLQPPLRTPWESEEDLPMMTYVSPLFRACCCIHRVLSCLFGSPTVPPSAVLVKRAAKIAAGGLPIRRRTMNAQESQIGGGEIVRKTQVMVAWHPRRCEL